MILRPTRWWFVLGLAAWGIVALIVMSILRVAHADPPRGAQTLIYSGPVTPLGYCQLTLNTATAKTLADCNGGTVPDGAVFATVTIETQAVRYRTDGTSPTSSVGMPLAVGTSSYFATGPARGGSGSLSSVKLIEQTSGAVLDVEFFK